MINRCGKVPMAQPKPSKYSEIGTDTFPPVPDLPFESETDPEILTAAFIAAFEEVEREDLVASGG